MLIDPKEKYSCLTDKERTEADIKRKTPFVVKQLMAACESLMAEVSGKRATDWLVVNDALVNAARLLAKIEGRTGNG